jgi:hypothetical protein
MRCVPVSFVVLAVALASGARAQSYGPEEQVLTIGAGELQPLSVPPLIESDGYAYYNGEYLHLAPLLLPEGAVVEKLCLYANDSDPTKGGTVEAAIVVAKLVPAGESPDLIHLVGERTTSSADVGYGSYCTDPFSYTLRAHVDVDEDGTVDAVVYYVAAGVPNPTINSLGFGGVRVFWRRAVTPPPATPTFGDVPATDPAFAYIEALAASGITAGCAGGNFCPEANLTRRQMAVFLAKALGLHWTD